jgi:hypothetical protein
VLWELSKPSAPASSALGGFLERLGRFLAWECTQRPPGVEQYHLRTLSQ